MTHIRQQVREAVAAALLPVASLGGRVHAGRPPRLQHPILPTAVVVVPSESIERDGVLGVHRQRRSIETHVHVVLEGSEAADTLDEVAEQIEAALAAASTLGGLLDAEIELAEALIDIDDTAATPVAELRMTYFARTTVLAAAPGTRA